MRSKSLLDIDVLESVSDDILAPPIEKIKEWLNENALKGYLDNVFRNGVKRFVPHYDDTKTYTYFTVYCIKILYIENQFPIFIPQALAGNMHMIDMEKIHKPKPLYIKKGAYIPYFIKKASEPFYEIEII